METDECCGQKTDCNDYEDGLDMNDCLMGMADDAWSDLMKEKMKKHYEKTAGPRLEKMASLAADARMAYWMNRMKAEAEEEAWQEKIKEAMKGT